MVCEPQVFKFIANDYIFWEQEPLEKLASLSQVTAFKHHGFWRPMDTLRDKRELDDLWREKLAPWKIWN